MRGEGACRRSARKVRRKRADKLREYAKADYLEREHKLEAGFNAALQRRFRDRTNPFRNPP